MLFFFTEKASIPKIIFLFYVLKADFENPKSKVGVIGLCLYFTSHLQGNETFGRIGAIRKVCKRWMENLQHFFLSMVIHKTGKRLIMWRCLA